MNYDKYIFHVDVNSAFLSWSAVKRLKDNPNALDLRKVPSAVGGDVKKRRGVITARSIPAKYRGVKSGEPVISALRKCPELILIPSEFPVYNEYSKAFIDILRKYSPIVEQMSIDEAFLDMTGMKNLYSKNKDINYEFPISIAFQLKEEIKNNLGFTVNVGISTNKVLAKMASDFSKPDKIHTLYPYELSQKLWPLPIDNLFGCGKVTAKKLKKVGIKTIGDAAEADIRTLVSLLGEISGKYIYESARGFGDGFVPSVKGAAKSYSHETTTSFDIDANNYDEAMPDILRALAESVAERLRNDGVFAKTIAVVAKTEDFYRHSMQRGLEFHTDNTRIIYDTALEMMNKMVKGKGLIFDKGLGVRLVGISASQIDNGEYRQMSLLDISNDMEHIEGNYNFIDSNNTDSVIDKIRKEFGKNAILYGYELNKNK